MYLERKHNIRAPSKGKVMNEKQMKRGSTAAKVGTAGAAGAAGVALAACAACCVPLVAPVVAPVLAWFGLSSLGMAATGWYVEIAAGSALALGGFLLLRHRKTKNRVQTCEADGSCGCGV
jgi:hypothetical protein